MQHSKRSPTLQAALWMSVASLGFSLMVVCIKYASQSFGTSEVVFFRGLVSLVIMAVAMRWRGTSLATTVPWMHAWRTVIGVAALTCWFYAISQLPLATAMTLNYMSSLWIAVFLIGGSLMMSKVHGQAQTQAPLMAAVLLGFGGVLLILRPDFTPDQWRGAVVGLFSGMGAALAYIQVTALGRVGEPEDRVVFYFALGTTLLGLLFMWVDGVPAHTWSAFWRDPNALWLLPIGVFASVGQWCMTRAYGTGATLVAACLQYLGIVFSCLFSLVLFGDRIAPWAWLGMGLIIASGIGATWYRSRTLPKTPAEDHS